MNTSGNLKLHVNVCSGYVILAVLIAELSDTRLDIAVYIQFKLCVFGIRILNNSAMFWDYRFVDAVRVNKSLSRIVISFTLIR